MNSTGWTRRLTLAVGGSAMVAITLLAAGCGSGTKEEPKTTSTPSSSAVSSSPAVAPTEKSAGGPNSFSPTVNPGQGGNSCTHVSNGVCTR